MFQGMFQGTQLSALYYISFALMILAHLVGLVVAIILLARKKGLPAVLATVAFALLFLLDIGRIINVAFLRRVLLQAVQSPRAIPWVSGSLDCCCGIFDLAAVILLIVALWQALVKPASGEGLEEEVEDEPLLEEEAPED